MDEAVRVKVRRVADVLAGVLETAETRGANGKAPDHTIHAGKTEILIVVKVKTACVERSVLELASEIAAATLDARSEAIESRDTTLFKVTTTTKRVQKSRDAAVARAQLVFQVQRLLAGSALLSLAWVAWRVLAFLYGAIVAVDE
jgi:hypothetical protein